MSSIKARWLDNPCRTIVEYGELQVMQRINTFKGSLTELKGKLDETDNEYAKMRVRYVLELVDKHIGKRMLNLNNYLIQGTIVEQVKSLLENYTEDEQTR